MEDKDSYFYQELQEQYDEESINYDDESMGYEIEYIAHDQFALSNDYDP